MKLQVKALFEVSQGHPGNGEEIISGSRTGRGGRQTYRGAEPSACPGGEGKAPVVCMGDGGDDRQPEADARVVAAYAFRATLERFGESGNELRRELLAGVLHRQHDGVGSALVVSQTVPWCGRLWTIALWTRFVAICSSSACDPRQGVCRRISRW